MARKLIVEIIGDSSSFDKALGKSSKSTQGFSASLKGFGKSAVLAGGAAGVAAVGVRELFGFLGDSVTAAKDAEVAHKFVAQAFKNAGKSADAYSKQIDGVGKSAVQLGFDDEEAQVSLGRFVAAGQSVGKSMREVAVAQDLARAKGVDLTTATTALASGLTGSLRPLKSLGIVIPPVTSHMDALRAAHVGIKGPIDAVAAAHAKYLDKLATGNEVIDATSNVVRGQAQAFSESASGGTERLRQQFENLQETVGAKLLPILTQTANFISQNWNTIGTVIATAFQVSKIAIESFIAPMRVVWALLHGDWSGAWNAFKAPAVAAINAVKAILSALEQLLRGPASAAWQAISNAARTAWQAVTSAVSNAVSAVRGAVGRAAGAARDLGQAILNGIKERLGKIWGAISNFATNISTAIAGVASSAVGWAAKIGSGIINGIINGLGGLIGRVKDKIVGGVTSAISDAWGALTGSPHVLAAIPIGVGIVLGVTKGIADTTSQIGQAIEQAVQAQITAARASLTSAFASFSSAAAGAFDTAGGGSAKTRELAKKLKAEQDAQTAKAAAEADAQRQQALATAQASGDPAAIAAAQKAIEDAKEQAKIAADAQALAEAQKRDKDAFEKQLAALETQAGSAKTKAALAKIQAKIKALLAEYGITPASVEAGADFNTAASLFTGAMGDLNKSMQALIAALDRLGGLPKKQHGGYLPGDGGIPIMAHGGEYVIRKKAVDKLGVGFLNRLNRYDQGGVIHPGKEDLSNTDPGYIDKLIEAERQARMKFGGGSIFNWRNWTPDIVNTATKWHDMLAQRYGDLIHFEGNWIPELYLAVQKSAGSIMEAPLARRPGNIRDLTHNSIWFDTPGGKGMEFAMGGRIPSFAMGGVMPHTGLAYLHKGETVSNGAPVVHVYVGEKEVAAIVRDTIAEDGRRGGMYPARVPS